jgi:hypothetical protein
MKEYKSIEEMADVPEDVWLAVSALDVQDDFMENLGGNMFILETLDDLALVDVFNLDNPGATLASSVGQFDIAEELAGGEHIMFVMITSNTGGATYFVPKHLWTNNVRESLIESN